MIPQKLRLNSSRIENLFKKGGKINLDNCFAARFLPSRDGTCRFCVIVNAKTAPGAVDRNRLRRQIYEIIRLHLELLTQPCDLAIICKKNATGLEFNQLREKIIQILNHLNK